MKKFLLALAFTFCVSNIAAAQNPVALWTQPEDPTTAQSFTYTLKIDAAAPITLTATCAQAQAPTIGSSCSAPFILNDPSGFHSYTLFATNALGTASTTISGKVPGTSGFKITVTVVVQTGDDEE